MICTYIPGRLGGATCLPRCTVDLWQMHAKIALLRELCMVVFATLNAGHWPPAGHATRPEGWGALIGSNSRESVGQAQ